MQTNKWIGRWLILGVVMLMIQVLLGGITRLTGSGLSITEWKPLLGALPPTNATEWSLLFEKYKQIAQFKYLNQDFTLGDFKFIFFWEWMHRNWARAIAVAFLIPFIYFFSKGMIRKELIPKLVFLFTLGIAQGLIGWIMVASGINDTNLYVSHIKLAIHFISALVLIAFTFYFALQILIAKQHCFVHQNLFRVTLFLVAILLLQLMYGAFMAGLKAATVAHTWPGINGSFLPDSIGHISLIHHPIAIHFIHRSLATFIGLGFLVWYWYAAKIIATTHFHRYKYIPLFFVVLQIILGILSVTHANQLTRNAFGWFEVFAFLHQTIAMCLAMSLVWVLYIVKNKS